jgi:hypothetical protein
MLNWLANRVATRLALTEHQRLADGLQELRDERDALRKEHRHIVAEVEDLLERFGRAVARDAMRRSRETKRAIQEREGEEEETPRAAEIPFHELDAKTRKQLLRRRMAPGMPRRASSE